MVTFGTIAELWRYPVSSMGGERLQIAELLLGGIDGDRLWGVLDKRTSEVAGPEKRRHWRPLPNLSSRLGADGPEIGNGDGAWLPASSAEAAQLVSNHLGIPAELQPHSKFQAHEQGRIAPRYDRADIHIVTTASMRTLAELLPDPEQVDSRRFRPNVVIETDSSFTGFAERQIIGRTLQIGDVRLTVTEPCARCAFTSIAQGNLTFEPSVLHKIAQHGDGGFGAYCAVVEGGEVSVGNEVLLCEE
jgi:uncharacterized protein YcbX